MPVVAVGFLLQIENSEVEQQQPRDSLLCGEPFQILGEEHRLKLKGFVAVLCFESAEEVLDEGFAVRQVLQDVLQELVVTEYDAISYFTRVGTLCHE